MYLLPLLTIKQKLKHKKEVWGLYSEATDELPKLTHFLPHLS